MKKPRLLLCLILSAGILAGCNSNSAGQQPADKKEQSSSGAKTTGETDNEKETETDSQRGQYEKQAAKLKKLYKENPDDADNALKYAQTLFTLGSFDDAEEILNPLLNEDNPSPDAIYVSAQIQYLNGKYTTAEELYTKLVKDHYDEYGRDAEAGLQMIYYQTNQFSKANDLFAGQDDLENPLLDLMKGFEDATPYEIDWNGREQTSIPFTAGEPLPVVPIEVNGVKMNAIIDTGAASLVIDETRAKEWGIESISKDEGKFAGGNTADIAYGKAESMKLGDVNLQNIPVMLGPFEGFSEGFSDIAGGVHAIIGTNLLQQFIPIMDYPSGRLVLLPRDEAGYRQLSDMQEKENTAGEIPFTLAYTHYMIAKGSINGYNDLNMFIDSGLAFEEAGIILGDDAMKILSIPVNDLKQADDGGGMGGNDFQEKTFSLASYGLGNLTLKDGVGYYFTGGAVNLFEDTGYISDALISHNYLKQYKWTINFDSMTMSFIN